jgi:hypothetical protein
MTSTDQRIAPGQPSDPAMFTPLTTDENKILRGHLVSGWLKQSAVSGRSGPYRDTAGFLDGLHDAHMAALEARYAARAQAGLAAPEPEAGA